MTQDVDRVEKATRPLDEISTKEAVEQLLGCAVESCSECTRKVVGRRPAATQRESSLQRKLERGSRGVVHPMVGAIHQAYENG
jgi:hypothetical protein